MTHHSAHAVAGAFDAGMQGFAGALGAALVANKTARQADRAEAAQLRGLAATVRGARAQDAARIAALEAHVTRLQLELAAANARAVRAEALLRRL